MFWIFVLFLNFFLFFIMFFDEKIDFCIEIWFSLIFFKIYGIFWLIVVGILFIVFMIILYLKVVY